MVKYRWAKGGSLSQARAWLAAFLNVIAERPRSWARLAWWLLSDSDSGSRGLHNFLETQLLLAVLISHVFRTLNSWATNKKWTKKTITWGERNKKLPLNYRCHVAATCLWQQAVAAVGLHLFRCSTCTRKIWRSWLNGNLIATMVTLKKWPKFKWIFYFQPCLEE